MRRRAGEPRLVAWTTAPPSWSGPAQELPGRRGCPRHRSRDQPRRGDSPCSGPTARARPPRWRSWRGSAAATTAPSTCWARTRPGRAGRGGPGSASSCSWPAPGRSSPCSRSSGTSPRSTPASRRAEEAIALVGLTSKAGSRIGQLSGGQTRRLDVALGIVGRPELLFLDEADHRLRPGGPPPVLGADQDAARGRHHDRADHALPGRGGGAGGPDRGQSRAYRIVAEGDPDTLGGRASAAARVGWDPPAGARRTVETGTPTATMRGTGLLSSAARSPAHRHQADARGRLPGPHRGGRGETSSHDARASNWPEREHEPAKPPCPARGSSGWPAAASRSRRSSGTRWRSRSSSGCRRSCSSCSGRSSAARPPPRASRWASCSPRA